MSARQDGRVFCSTDTPELLVYGVLFKPEIEIGWVQEKEIAQDDSSRRLFYGVCQGQIVLGVLIRLQESHIETDYSGPIARQYVHQCREFGPGPGPTPF